MEMVKGPRCNQGYMRASLLRFSSETLADNTSEHGRMFYGARIERRTLHIADKGCIPERTVHKHLDETSCTDGIDWSCCF